MDNLELERMFSRVEYFYNIHMDSYHVKIANLAYEEYLALLLEIISIGGWEKLKVKITGLNNKKFQQRLLTILTPIDVKFCSNLYKKFLDEKIPEYIESQPYGWLNFTESEYLDGARKLLEKISEKRKLKFVTFN